MNNSTETRTVNITRSMVDDGEYSVTVGITKDEDCVYYAYWSEQSAKGVLRIEDVDFPLTDEEIADWVKLKEHADFAVIE